MQYSDADGDSPASGYPKVHIKQTGVEIAGNPFTMNFVSGNYTTGATFTYSKILIPAADYTYYFDTFDTYGVNTATIPIDAPDVTNNGPILSFAGDPNYLSSGVYPLWAKPGTMFFWKVKYSDSDGDTPATGYPKLHVLKEGSEITGSPFITKHETGTYLSGTIYGCSKVLDVSGRGYVYYFEAFDTFGIQASGELVYNKNGPNVAISEAQGKLIPVNNLFSAVNGEKVQIQYEVTERNRILITVHDMSGKQIISLLDETKDPGLYTSLTWDGRNSKGEYVASGVYIIYINAGSYKDMKKVIIVN